MTGSVAARRYAKALFDLARRDGPDSLDAIGQSVRAVASATRENADLARLFRDPVFSPEEKRAVVTALAERLQLAATVRNFCCLLADKQRLVLLEAIAGEFQILSDAEKGVIRGEFISAAPLDEKKQQAVRGELEKKAGKTLVLNFSVDESLLGGMLLKVGDNVMDASLKTQLILLKDTIKRGE
ncbi:MAG: F0F1 ATP synthase subunit delta [Deltaproteobacteria bacterium]|jgi:F-type H+-transporting ATPase subunit delta|nr:F0F1 ATP synthase subunit delta [Deltaproteobacteria bacterium]